MGARYNELLSDLSELELPPTQTPYAENTYWVYGVIWTMRSRLRPMKPCAVLVCLVSDTALLLANA